VRADPNWLPCHEGNTQWAATAGADAAQAGSASKAAGNQRPQSHEGPSPCAWDGVEYKQVDDQRRIIGM